MDQLITGTHHVTAVAGNAQKNIDFYTGILGLRLVKKTVNFEEDRLKIEQTLPPLALNTNNYK